MLEETKLKANETMKCESSDHFNIFYLNRQNSQGGGLALGVHKEIESTLIREGNDETEMLSVQAVLGKIPVRIIVAYGPQENAPVLKKQSFWEAIEKEVCEADIEGHGVLLQMDGNLHAGGNIVKGDPNPMNKNGKLFVEFLERNKSLNVINSLNECEGVITRRRKLENKTEEAVLDFCVINDKMRPFLQKMVIDESREFCLVNVDQVKKNGRIIETDHNSMIIEFGIRIEKQKPAREVMFNLKNKACQDKFKEETENNDDLIECFKNSLTVEEQCSEWNKTFNKVLQKCFKKVRIVNSKKKENSKLKNMLLERIRLKKGELKITDSGNCNECEKIIVGEERLKEHMNIVHEKQNEINCYKCEDRFDTIDNLKAHIITHTKEKNFECRKCTEETKTKIENRIHQIEEDLGRNISEEYRKEVLETLKLLGDDTYSINGSGRKQLWKLLKKNYPKIKPAIPVGKRNNKGKIITNHSELKQLYLQTYLHRLRNRPGNDDLQEIRKFKSELFKIRLKSSEFKKSEPWKIGQLDKVLHQLKNDKARDPSGLINEIFKEGIAGKDFKHSLLELFNKMKENNFIPEFVRKAIIATIYKGKGEKCDLKNERGIFLVSIFRSILMKLIYADNYEDIDNSMSDSQVGGRKAKNVRNHIWVVNGIICDILSSKKKNPIDIQIFDFKQCFDSLWLEECMNDIHNGGLKNDKFALLFNMNTHAKVVVKTPLGKTEQANIYNAIIQGDVFAPLMCSKLVDTFGKDCLEETKYLFKYKGLVDIPPLGMVDDLI